MAKVRKRLTKHQVDLIPVDERYTTITAMQEDQVNQTPGFFYFANGTYFEYLGGDSGVLTVDYQMVSSSDGFNRIIPFIWIWDGTPYVDIPTGGDGESWRLVDLVNVISWRGDGYSPTGNQIVYPSIDGTRLNLWEGSIDPQIGDKIYMTLKYMVV